MSIEHPFLVPVADLLRGGGGARAVTRSAPIAELRNRAAEVPGDRAIAVEVTLERVTDGIVVRGLVHASWDAPCSRCLAPVSGAVDAPVDELYERHPVEGETYALDGDTLDLEPMVRDALLVELPAAPCCRASCAGLCPRCGIDRNYETCECTSDEPDPRWAALDSLEL